LGETFLLETVFSEGVSGLVGSVWSLVRQERYLCPWKVFGQERPGGEPCSAGAFLVSLARELSGEETISSTSVGCCLEKPADLEVRRVL